MKIVIPKRLKDYEDMVLAHSLSNAFSVPEYNSDFLFFRGNQVVFNGILYRALEFNYGKQPDLYPDFWYPLGAWDNDNEQVYDSDATYSTGALVTHYSGYKKQMYRSLVDNNTGNTPSASPEQWQDIGAVNLYRCLYGKTENKTEALNSLSLTVDANKTDSVYMLGIKAHDATIEILDADDNVLKTYTQNLQYKNATSWSRYYFDDFTYATTCGTYGYLGFNYKARFTLTSTDIVRLGTLIVGRTLDVGKALWGATAGILDFSRVKRDENFGDTYLAQGSYAKKCDVVLTVSTSRADSVMQILTSIRGQEALFLADDRDDGFDMLKIRGFIRDFEVTLQNAVITEITLQIEGLI